MIKLFKKNLLIFSVFFSLLLMGLPQKTHAQSTANYKKTVKIFQFQVKQVSPELLQVLKKSDEVLHYRAEQQTVVLYANLNFSVQNLEALFNQANVDKFQILRADEGVRNAKLFKKD